MHSSKKLILTLLLASAVAGWVCAAPLGTAISYQGYLSDKGKPATDLYNLRFALYDAMTGGSLVGSPNTVTLSSVPVTNGLFSVALDFGSSAFLGDRRWLEIEVAPNGSSSYTKLSPRTELRPDAYSLYALKADTATTVGSVPWSALTGVPAGFADGTDDNTTYSAGAGLHLSGTTFSIADGGVTSSKLANGQVVRSLNGLTEALTLSVGAGLTLTPNGNTLTLAASGGSSGWSLTGNAGTTAGLNFLGTTDSQPLELKVNNGRVLRMEAVFSLLGGSSVNTIGGLSVNRVSNGAIGATIAGGGNGTFIGDFPNEVSADFGSIGGGAANSVGGRDATIPGGFGNRANGEGSFAAGQLAHADHDGSFVWGDGTGQAVSRGPNRFDVRATGGASFFTGNNYFRVAGPFLQVGGAASEEAYIGGDGAGGDVQMGSFNPAVANVALYNAGNNTYMNLVANTAYFGGDASCSSLTIRGGADIAEPFRMSPGLSPCGRHAELS